MTGAERSEGEQSELFEQSELIEQSETAKGRAG
jgi:hypothetical protein